MVHGNGKNTPFKGDRSVANQFAHVEKGAERQPSAFGPGFSRVLRGFQIEGTPRPTPNGDSHKQEPDLVARFTEDDGIPNLLHIPIQLLGCRCCVHNGPGRGPTPVVPRRFLRKVNGDVPTSLPAPSIPCGGQPAPGKFTEGRGVNGMPFRWRIDELLHEAWVILRLGWGDRLCESQCRRGIQGRGEPPERCPGMEETCGGHEEGRSARLQGASFG